MTTIVVLGSTGMLGSMVTSWLTRNERFRVTGTTRREFDAEAFVENADARLPFEADYIINCIGITKPHCKDSDPAGVRRALTVNAAFPHKLASQAARKGTRVIQIATDCVYSGARGTYLEGDAHDATDVYGKTKSLGEVFTGELLNIRCSIIGPEAKGKTSLLEWFLRNPDGSTLSGFAHHLWNGVTTLQFAQLCERIVLEDRYASLLATRHTLHYAPNETVDKFELLNLMADVFSRQLTINRVDDVGPPVDRSLGTQFEGLLSTGRRPMRDALAELCQYMAKAK